MGVTAMGNKGMF